MDKYEILSAINKWQDSEITSIINCEKCNKKVIGKEINGKTVLYCTECGHVESHIPEAIIRYYERGIDETLPIICDTVGCLKKLGKRNGNVILTKIYPYKDIQVVLLCDECKKKIEYGTREECVSMGCSIIENN